MREKIFSIISFICLVLVFMTLDDNPTRWYSAVDDMLFSISRYTPFMLSALGLISAFFGVRKGIRTLLVAFHLLALGLFLLMFFQITL